MSDEFEIIRPAWCDPRFVGSLNDSAFRVQAVLANTPTRIARLDPTRWAIAFFFNPSSTIDTNYAPDRNAQFGGFRPTGNCPVITFTLFKHGPIVCQEWWAFSAVSGNAVWMETSTES